MDNGRQFVIIILLQKETRVATCGNSQAHTFLHDNTRASVAGLYRTVQGIDSYLKPHFNTFRQIKDRATNSQHHF